MKKVKITYYCDYCKQLINPDDEPVCYLQTGKIGYQDSLIPDPDESVKHYHDYCINYLLALNFGNDKKRQEQEPVKEQASEEEAPEEPTEKAQEDKWAPPKKRPRTNFHDTYTGPIKKGEKDLGAVKALFDANWTAKEIAVEVGMPVNTIYRWKYEIKKMIEEGRWEKYLEERRNKKDED